MKKKVLYGVFMACCAFSAVGTLQSCKDDLGDFEHQYVYDQYVVDKAINDLKASLDACRAKCAAEIADLQAQITANDGDIKALQEDITRLEGLIADRVTLEQLDGKLSQLKTDLEGYTDDKIGKAKQEIEQKLATDIAEINGLISDLSGKVGENAGQIAENAGKIAELSSKFTEINDEVVKLNEKIVGFETSLNNKQAQIDAINATLKEISITLGNQQSVITGVLERLIDVEKGYDALNDEFESFKTQNRQELDELWMFCTETLRTEMTQMLNLLQGQLDDLNTEFDTMIDRVNKLVTSILIQATDSPVFGNFSLPLGVKSNLIFDWYGYNMNDDFSFPTANAEYSYDKENVNVDFANAPKFTVPNGYLADEFNLGRLYLTVNPVGVDFDNTSFFLETSNGNRLPYSFKVRPSDHELYFGYTRGVDNGFYEADVIMPATAEAINATKIEIDENLKTTVKAALNDPSKRTAYNLLRAVYDQLNGMLPAYAVRYDWTYGESAVANSVLSQYDLAVATARPLSYAFLYGQGTSKQLPTYGHLDNLFDNLIDKDKFKFELNSSINIGGFTINYTDLYFDFSNVEVDVDRKEVWVVIPRIDVLDEVTGEIIGHTEEKRVLVEDLDGVYDSIEKGFQEAIAELGKDLNKQINKEIRDKLLSGIQDEVNAMLNDINTQINDMLKDLENQINGQISDMIDDIVGSIKDKTEPVFNRVNQMIDLYNKVAGKINNFLRNPNHYLQVAMIYKGNGTVGLLSNDKSDPTVFVNAGGNAISLYASSYTAEIAAPAFKKYIAVTAAYDAKGNKVNADIKAINEASGLNQVFDGGVKRVGVAASKLQKGLTYEIVYQGLDYSGVTSTQKFYIKVK